jgi:hypothetical protein
MEKNCSINFEYYFHFSPMKDRRAKDVQREIKKKEYFLKNIFPSVST